MRFNILADAEWNSGVGQVIAWLAKSSYFDVFQQQNYGAGLEGISLFLICRDPCFQFKRRVRHSKKEKKLYVDVMLDFATFVIASTSERRRLAIEAILKDLPDVLMRKRVDDFDNDAFLADFHQKFEFLLDHSTEDDGLS